MMGRNARLQAFQPVVVAQRIQIPARQSGGVCRSDLANPVLLGGVEECRSVGHQRPSGVVAALAREDEHDRWQLAVGCEMLDDLRTPRARRPSAPRALPPVPSRA